MTKRFGLSALLGAGVLVLSTTGAMAQSGNSASPSASSAPMGASSSMSAPSSMGSSGSMSASGSAGAGGGSNTLGSVDTSVTTTDSVGGGMDPSMDSGMSDGSGTLPRTGGEPLIISMMGALVAGSGLLLRRKFN